ncbi:DNA repair protein RecO [Candidatus Saccharibacteria bacterium]|nr:DNA repair protein RecO [Candidatus Saccharibacteria bacterium]
MIENAPKDLKTRALVLRRTNYGETDRIINLITPVGKVSAIAKGVRKEKSKLAGGMEMFCLVEVNLHFGKSEMATMTGARMLKFYQGILKDLGRLELASEFLKKINRVAENVDTAAHFEILNSCLAGLDAGLNPGLIESWFLINLAKSMGEQINLYTDGEGEKLDASCLYVWDSFEKVLKVHPDGPIDADTIKILRLLWSTELGVVVRIKNVSDYVPEILNIARTFVI